MVTRFLSGRENFVRPVVASAGASHTLAEMKPPRILPLILLLALTHVRADDRPAASVKWENEIAAFEKADREHPPEKGGIVFVGSSSIRLW